MSTYGSAAVYAAVVAAGGAAAKHFDAFGGEGHGMRLVHGLEVSVTIRRHEAVDANAPGIGHNGGPPISEWGEEEVVH